YLAAIKFGGDVLVTAPGGGLPNKTRELVRHGGMSSFPYARSALDVARRSSPCRWDPALEPPAAGSRLLAGLHVPLHFGNGPAPAASSSPAQISRCKLYFLATQCWQAWAPG
ncbi:unnamed protein product, partial [Urochloa humidicola]